MAMATVMQDQAIPARLARASQQAKLDCSRGGHFRTKKLFENFQKTSGKDSECLKSENFGHFAIVLFGKFFGPIIESKKMNYFKTSTQMKREFSLIFFLSLLP